MLYNPIRLGVNKLSCVQEVIKLYSLGKKGKIQNMFMIFLYAIFPVISSHGLLIICTAETHRKYSNHRQVLLIFYIKKTLKSTIVFEAVLLSANIISKA